MFNHTYVFTPRLVNEFRVGYNRMFQYLVSTEDRDLPTLLGITGTQSNIYPGPPTISISGTVRPPPSARRPTTVWSRLTC